MCSSRVVVRCISPPFSRVYCGRVAITHVMMQCHDAHGADTPFLIVFPPINANPFQDMSKKKKGKKKEATIALRYSTETRFPSDPASMGIADQQLCREDC